ncbi:hypothetical protein CDAR_488011 [Caerostris darwini]|uniref:Uncharacterized protein n=1 Tax=Caerostris darwini TaxID=1538125 RepID=A0AAV4MDK8_9ARAC|nr:hypothetical protein CDAR_488011 [Caerostris darwini]
MGVVSSPPKKKPRLIFRLNPGRGGGRGEREEAQRSGATSAFSKLRCHLRDMGVVPIITTRAVAAWNVGCVLRKRASALVKRKEKKRNLLSYTRTY